MRALKQKMKKFLSIGLMTAALTFAGTAVSMAGTWMQYEGSWFYCQDDGSFAKGWQWIDAGNGVSKSYYFDASGKMASNAVIDGYTVNASGAWTQNGQEVTKQASRTAAVNIVRNFVETGGNEMERASDSAMPSVSAGPMDGVSLNAPESSSSPIVNIAMKYVGPLPYILGGNSLTTGTDCSGFTRLVFAQAGKTLPRTSAQQFAAAPYHPTEAELQPGDLIFYGNGSINHVAIYAGDGIIHQTNSSRNCVAYDRNGAGYNVVHYTNIIGFGRY